jgi:hypothetical protein
MSRVSRRKFVVATALAGLAGSALPAVAAASSENTAEKSSPANPEVEARLQWIFTKYGAHLSEEQRADIRRIVSSGQPGIDAMRSFALDNSMEPATRFRVWRRS